MSWERWLVITHPAVTSEPHQPSFSDLKSVGNCHAECDGCSEPNSAVSCFSCKHFTQTLRNRAGFKCVSKCGDGFFAENDKCKKCSANCKTCSTAELCDSCQGSLLLIETHTVRTDQRHCVKVCPIGLVPDFSHAVQARCMIREDVCAPGYYLGMNNKCQLCDKACDTCHGPGPLECTTCAKGYGNGTIGYCRECCQGEDTPESTHHQCEDCRKKLPQDESGGFFSTVLIVVILSGLGYCIYTVVKKNCCGTEDKSAEYALLSNTDERFGAVDSDDEVCVNCQPDQVTSSSL
ncbi:unnamed protein product [Bursaphelenchus okinawaensis]|uniref:Growth factor receptor domain-containing protein n=1 Tax=Bursaphelenchus okinawaensis TaxID=465554 RepID=A0A811JV90_9BILA|nr:unnamed protein product [Bursaphelenchus okinawaensis]CAG9084544.1 unnamed protein product [Bursaphelenchus okinawaensis]